MAELVPRVRRHTNLPLLVGFGISTPEHAAAALAAGADGVIVGSRAIETAEEGGADALREFVASLAAAMG